MTRSRLLSGLLIALGCSWPTARAQNDWQFPDPHFGIAEFGPGRPGPVTERQYRDAIAPEGRYAAPGLHRPRPQPHQPRPRLLRPRRSHGR